MRHKALISLQDGGTYVERKTFANGKRKVIVTNTYNAGILLLDPEVLRNEANPLKSATTDYQFKGQQPFPVTRGVEFEGRFSSRALKSITGDTNDLETNYLWFDGFEETLSEIWIDGGYRHDIVPERRIVLVSPDVEYGKLCLGEEEFASIAANGMPHSRHEELEDETIMGGMIYDESSRLLIDGEPLPDFARHLKNIYDEAVVAEKIRLDTAGADLNAPTLEPVAILIKWGKRSERGITIHGEFNIAKLTVSVDIEIVPGSKFPLACYSASYDDDGFEFLDGAGANTVEDYLWCPSSGRRDYDVLDEEESEDDDDEN